jgi:hypothetical protein
MFGRCHYTYLNTYSRLYTSYFQLYICLYGGPYQNQVDMAWEAAPLFFWVGDNSPRKGERHFSGRAHWSLFFQKKNLNFVLKKIQKKLEHSLWFLLHVCEFILWNTLNSSLSKTNKILSGNTFSDLGTCFKICLIYLFCWAYNRRYFTIKICTIGVYIVGYIQVLNFKMPISKKSKKGSMVPGCQPDFAR